MGIWRGQVLRASCRPCRVCRCARAIRSGAETLGTEQMTRLFSLSLFIPFFLTSPSAAHLERILFAILIPFKVCSRSQPCWPARTLSRTLPFPLPSSIHSGRPFIRLTFTLIATPWTSRLLSSALLFSSPSPFIFYFLDTEM